MRDTDYYKRLYELEKARREELENELRKIYQEKAREKKKLEGTRDTLVEELLEMGQFRS